MSFCILPPSSKRSTLKVSIFFLFRDGSFTECVLCAGKQTDCHKSGIRCNQSADNTNGSIVSEKMVLNGELR